MSFSALYEFLSTSFSLVVTSLSRFLVSLLVTPFPTLLRDLSKTEGLPQFLVDVLSDLSAFVSDISMFNAPLFVVLLGAFLIFFVVISIAKWILP